MKCSFVLGRNITDNIIIAQEIVHTMRIMKGKKKVFAIKVNLQKVYNCFRWEFILDTLMDIGILRGLISLIMKCVSTSSIQISWNGNLSTSFIPLR